MKHTKKILLQFISMVPLAFPLLVLAEDVDHGYVEIGAGLVKEDDNAAKAGEYTGIEDGGYLISNFNVSKETGGSYTTIHGRDLGLDSRALSIEMGSYNSYKLWLNYDELVHLISRNAQTPYLGVGTNQLTLPSGFDPTPRDTTNSTYTQAAQPTNNDIGVVSDMANLAGALKATELSTDRTATSVGGTIMLSDRLTARFGVKHEEKEGVMELGGVVGYGGDPVSTILPKPIDYTTDNISAGLSYNDDVKHLDVEYALSNFTNANPSLTWDNAFEDACSRGNCILLPSTARNSLEPDNEYSRLSLNGAMKLTDTLRASVVFEKGNMSQNEGLLPYRTGDVSALNPLPRNSAEADIDTQHLQLRLSGKPTQRLSLSAKYRSYEQDNNTTVDDFERTRHDTDVTQQAGTENHPYSYKQKSLQVDGSYYLGAGTTLRLGAEQEDMHRTKRARKDTTDNILSAKLNTRIGSKVSASLGYAHAKRDGGDYDSDAYAAGSHELMRQLDLWDRTRKELTANVHLAVTSTTSVSVIGSRNVDDYADDDTFGLKESSQRSYTLDISHSPKEGVTAYGYITKDNHDAEQDGRSFTSAPGAAADNWTAHHDDDALTLGLGGQAQLMEERLKVRLNVSRAAGTYDVDYIVGASTNQMAQAKTSRTTIELSGAYDLTESLALGLGYKFENYDEVDFLNEGYMPADTRIDQVLLLRGEAEDYTLHAIYAAVAYKW